MSQETKDFVFVVIGVVVATCLLIACIAAMSVWTEDSPTTAERLCGESQPLEIVLQESHRTIVRCEPK